jgi:hypothetical protein
MANATPVLIPESVIGFKATPNSAGIAPILKSLSTNAAHNARCLVGVQNEVEGLRETIAKLEDRLNRQHAAALDLGKTMEAKFAAQAAVIDGVSERTATKTDLRTEVAKLWKDVNVATSFVRQVESQSCDSLVAFTRGYIEKFLPVWYEETSQETLGVVRRIVKESQDQTHSLLEQRVSDCDQRAAQAAQNVQAIAFQSMCQMNDERRRDIHRQRMEIDENIRLVVASMDKQLFDHGVQMQTNHAEACARLLQLEDSCRALRSTLCIDDSLAREMHNQHVHRTHQHPNFLVASLNADTITVDVLPDHQEPMDVSVTNASSMDESSNSGAYTPATRRKKNRAPEKEVHTLEICRTDPLDNITDQRVVRVAQTPHFFALRSSLMRDIAEWSDMIRSDLHSDMISEIFDLQRELKGKVGNSKIAELLVQHRDQQLYTNVKNLLGDVAELRSVKVDQTMFLESLRSKVDHRMIEGKADKATLVSLNEQMLIKVEELSKNVQRVDNRLQSNEFSIASLSRQLQRGGGDASVRMSQSFKPSDFSTGGGSGELGAGPGLSPHRRLTAGVGVGGESEVATDRRGISKEFIEGTSPTVTEIPLVVVGANGLERPPTQDGVAKKRTATAGSGGDGRRSPPTPSSVANGRPLSQPRNTTKLASSGGSASSARPAMGSAATPRPNATSGGGPSKPPVSPRLDHVGGPGLIPLTKFQQAYCEALELDPTTAGETLQRAVQDKFSSQQRNQRHVPDEL